MRSGLGLWRPSWPGSLGTASSTGLTAKSTGGSPLAGHMPIVPQSQPLPSEGRVGTSAGAAHNPILAPPQVQLTYPGHHSHGYHWLNRSPSPHFRGPQTSPHQMGPHSNVQAGAHVTILRQIALEKSAPPLLFPPAFHFWLFSASPTHYDPGSLLLGTYVPNTGLHFPVFLLRGP